MFVHDITSYKAVISKFTPVRTSNPLFHRKVCGTIVPEFFVRMFILATDKKRTEPNCDENCAEQFIRRKGKQRMMCKFVLFSNSEMQACRKSTDFWLVI
jgi:hypothetical protein